MTIQRTQTLIAAALGGVAALVLVAGVALLVLPQRSHAHRLRGDVASEQAQLATDRAALAAPVSTPVKINAADLFRLSEAMPDSDRMPQILTDLSELAGESSVHITSVKPATEVSMQGYSALPLTINVTGKYANVSAFSRRLHDAVEMRRGHLQVGGRLFVVNQIQLSSPDGRTISAQMSLDAFDYVPVVAPAAGTSTPTSTTAGAST